MECMRQRNCGKQSDLQPCCFQPPGVDADVCNFPLLFTDRCGFGGCFIQTSKDLKRMQKLELQHYQYWTLKPISLQDPLLSTPPPPAYSALAASLTKPTLEEYLAAVGAPIQSYRFFESGSSGSGAIQARVELP